MLAVIVFAGVILMAIFADLIAPLNPLDMVNMPFLWPFEDPFSPLGTDQLGRDLFSGIAVPAP